MRRTSAGLLSLVLATGLGTTLGVPSVSAAPGGTVHNAGTRADKPDDAAGHELPNPLEEKRRALRQEALTEVLNGTARPERRGASRVVKVSSRRSPEAVDARGRTRRAAATTDQYVELGREKTDKIFTILVEFGDQRDPTYPDRTRARDAGRRRATGRLHNKIAAAGPRQTTARPGRRTTTRRTSRTSTSAPARAGEHESLKKYYEKQSSGRYSVDGEVSDWVKVPYNEARYGSNDSAATTTSAPTRWDLVQRRRQRLGRRPEGRRPHRRRRSRRTWRSTTSGTATTSTATATSTSPTATSTTSRSCTPARTSPPAARQGEDAIWAHRWYAYGTDAGRTGPAEQQARRHPDRRHRHLGRRLHHPAGERRPRRLRPRVRPRPRPARPLRHHRRREHRRLLDPDVPGRGSAPARTAIGDLPGDMSAWDKLQLGWLDYDTAKAAQNRTHKLGVAEYNTARHAGARRRAARRRRSPPSSPPPAEGSQAVVERQRRRPQTP